MNLKEIVSKVSSETSLPASDVRKVTNAIMGVLISNVEAGENFISSRLNINAITLKSKDKIDKNGLKKTIPERKSAIFVIKPAKSKKPKINV